MLNPLNDNSHYRFQGGHCLIKSLAKKPSDMGILVWRVVEVCGIGTLALTTLPPPLLLLPVYHGSHTSRQTAEYLLPTKKGSGSLGISVPGFIDVLSFAQQ